ncbi:MAG: hypothetical protein Q7S79_02815 [bacterium]|nr:hypothetical protein [bacterium]
MVVERAPVRERKMLPGEAFIRRLFERRAGNLYPKEVEQIMIGLLIDAEHEPQALQTQLIEAHDRLLKIVKKSTPEQDRRFSWALICGRVQGLSKRGTREVNSWKNLKGHFGATRDQLAWIDWSLNYRQTFPETQPSLRDKQAKRVRIHYWEDGSPARAFFIADADPFSPEKAAVAYSIEFPPISRQSSA